MTEMADKIAALKAAHEPKMIGTGKPSMAALIAMAASLGVDAPQQKPPELQMPEQASADEPARKRQKRINTGFYNKREWRAMQKRRKQAHAAKRRNRRG